MAVKTFGTSGPELSMRVPVSKRSGQLERQPRVEIGLHARSIGINSATWQ